MGTLRFGRKRCWVSCAIVISMTGNRPISIGYTCCVYQRVSKLGLRDVWFNIFVVWLDFWGLIDSFWALCEYNCVNPLHGYVIVSLIC